LVGLNAFNLEIDGPRSTRLILEVIRRMVRRMNALKDVANPYRLISTTPDYMQAPWLTFH
jgi:hypothetical protein